MTISSASKWLGMVCIVSCLALGAVWQYAFAKLSVGGPVYAQIVNAKDIVADVLPPPLYIIEPYLDATLALNDRAQAADKGRRAIELRRSYDERHGHWLKAPIDRKVRAVLTVEANAPAQEFWRVLFDDFYPAIEAGKFEQARTAYISLSAHYSAHRLAIDRVVTLANTYTKVVEDSAADTRGSIFYLALLASLMVLGLIAFSVYAAISGVSRPMTLLGNVMGQLSSGKLDASIPLISRRDELGDMARSVVVFRDAVKRMLELEKEADAVRALSEAQKRKQLAEEKDAERRAAQERERLAQENERAQRTAIALERELVNAHIGTSLARLAGGNLAIELVAELPESYLKLKRDFNDALAKLRDAIGEVTIVAKSVGIASAEINTAADSFARRIEHQAASLEEATAALNLVSNVIQSSMQAIERTDKVLKLASDDATYSTDIVKRAGEAMKRIEQSSSQITSIISIIDEIAFQTNLLALNAGVEAARAGEAGRGFAVVASEVRALAQRSATAAQEIKALVKSAIDEVGSGVGLVNDTERALVAMAGRIVDLREIVTHITSSSRDQADKIREISTAVGQIDSIIQQSAAIAEQTSAATNRLAADGDRLGNLVDQFVIDGAFNRRPALALVGT